jgi:hypothetical protein
MTLRQTITILTICVFGAMGVVFAQDDDENNDDDVNITESNEEADNPPESKKTEKSKKSGKSKSKSGKSDESGSITETSASEKQKKEKAAAADGTTLKYNGLVASGVDFIRKVNRKSGTAIENKRVLKGELELSAQPVKKVRAVIGLEYNANSRVMVVDSLKKGDRVPVNEYDGTWALSDVDPLKGLALGPFVTIDKIYAQYNIFDNGAVRAGIMKKSFGLEERAGLDERYFLKGSIIGDGLEDLGFLDHDLTAAYRQDLLHDALRLTGAFSWSVADSSVYLQNYSAHYRPAKNTELLLAGVIKHNTGTNGGNPSATYAASLSFKYEAVSWWVTEAEATLGTNPIILELYNRKTTLFGARLQEQFPIDLNTKTLRRVVPVMEVAVFTADIDSGYSTKPFDPTNPGKPDKSDVETQLKAGITLGFAKNSAFQFRNNLGMIIRTPKEGESSVKRYRLDSEIIVIF